MCKRCYGRAWREANPGYSSWWAYANPERMAVYRDRDDRKRKRGKYREAGG